MKSAYYNEIDDYAARWLRNLIAVGLIPDGDVDERDIRDVRPDDLRGYRQAHFFAGCAGWPLAFRLAGWPDDRPVWSGSCPCQSFSAAGCRNGLADERHVWRAWFWHIQQCRPPIIFGEQVPRAINFGWLDEVADDLESQDYAFALVVLSACFVEARQERERLWFVARANSVTPQRPAEPRAQCNSWPAEPAVSRVAHGIPEQPSIRRALGNAVVPAAAAQFIMMTLEVLHERSKEAA